jgi:hypothetical protein
MSEFLDVQRRQPSLARRASITANRGFPSPSGGRRMPFQLVDGGTRHDPPTRLADGLGLESTLAGCGTGFQPASRLAGPLQPAPRSGHRREAACLPLRQAGSLSPRRAAQLGPPLLSHWFRIRLRISRVYRLLCGAIGDANRTPIKLICASIDGVWFWSADKAWIRSHRLTQNDGPRLHLFFRRFWH